jgi:integral membrane protein (TIGR01906 family)
LTRAATRNAGERIDAHSKLTSKGRARVEDVEALDNVDPQPHNAAVAAAGRQRKPYMGFARTLASVLFVVALPIALLTTNIRLLANAPLVYDYAFDRYDAAETTGLSREDLDHCGAELREYFNNGEKTFYCPVTENGLPTPIFTARETAHMEDVKALFVLVNRAQEASIVYVLLYAVAFFIWAREGSVRQLAQQSLMGLALGAVAIGGIGIVAAFGFESAFERFHTVAFTNDLWKLNPATDHLIQMFPEGFWRDMTILLGAMCALEALLIGAISAVYLIGSRGERTHLAGRIDLHPSSPQAA